MAESAECALEFSQSRYGWPGLAGENSPADERAGIYPRGCAGGAVLSHGAAGRQGYFGFTSCDSAQGSGRGLEGLRSERPYAGKKIDGQRGCHSRADLAIVVVSPSGDDFVFGDHGAATVGATEDQEFLHQMAAGAAEDSVAGDDGAAYYAANAGVSEDCA